MYKKGCEFFTSFSFLFVGASDHSVFLAEEIDDWVDCLREYLAKVDLIA